MMTQRYDAALDLFATDGINEALKKMGTEFSLTIAPRNVVVKPKNCCACTAFDWPLEKVQATRPSLAACKHLAASGGNKHVKSYVYFYHLKLAAAARHVCVHADQGNQVGGGRVCAACALHLSNYCEWTCPMQGETTHLEFPAMNLPKAFSSCTHAA
eukprot:2431336-Pleurochrysis_carterae.AAC.3